jgi:hypothetical protein
MLIREQIVLRENRKFPVKVQGDYRIVIGPGDKIHSTFTPSVHRAAGRRVGETRSGLFTLGQEREVKTSGGGQGVWTYADQTLTYRRSFKQGAYRMTIAFARHANGLTCSASEAFARENGVGAIVLDSAMDGLPTTIVSASPVSSTCRVMKR